MKIHEVSDGNGPADKNRYCGPSAISILTGMTTGEAARLLRHVSGRKLIRGASVTSVRRALAMCNVRTTPMWGLGLKKLTLAGWLKQTLAKRTTGRVFLVLAGNHYQVITGRRYACGRIRKIVSITDKKVKRRARVEEAYECTVPGRLVIPSESKKQKSRTDRWTQKAYAAFRKFVTKHGLQYSIYDEGGCKYIAVHATPYWPEGLDTMHYDFDQTLGRLQHCMDHPEDVVEGGYSE